LCLKSVRTHVLFSFQNTNQPVYTRKNTDSLQRHFTQLVAVGPFAVLGLVLMASVARVCRITGITTLYEEIASEDMKGVLTAVDDGLVANEFGGLLEEEQEEWDKGVLVEREE